MKKLAIALLAISLAACSDNNNVVTPLQTVPGDYVLKTINGTALPVTFSDGVTLNTDVLTLFDDGTSSETMQLADGRVFVDQGVYTVNNNSLTFTDETAGFSYSGSLVGATLTAVFPDGTTEVFLKR
ncbi:MAG: hypothetical protein ACREPM_16445 [Gemmatimonadaceae bacterium]